MKKQYKVLAGLLFLIILAGLCTLGCYPPADSKEFDNKGIAVEKSQDGEAVKATGSSSIEAPTDLALLIRGDGIEAEQLINLRELGSKPGASFQHIYSTVNNWPLPRFYAAHGINLHSILEQAGVLNTAQVISFVSSDGYQASFTREQLLDTQRYYYPQVAQGSEKGAEPVEPIIAYAYREASTELEEAELNVPCLIFGQKNPSEYTNPAFVVKVKEIVVSSQEALTWERASTFPLLGKIARGESVKLEHKYLGRVKLYYTLDDTDPTELSSLYIVITFQPELNVPISINEDTLIKVLVTGYGQKDSPISSFFFQVQ